MTYFLALMRTGIYPTKLNLKEIDEDGSEFLYSRSSGELNESLKDLIQSRNYQVKINLKQMGNIYEITGKIETSWPTQCARCGRDTIVPIDESFSEIILVVDEKPRAGHSGHTGSLLDDGPFCNYQSSYELDLSEFIHEHIASVLPYTPHCHQADCEDILLKTHVPEEDDIKEANPFAVLKNLSFPSQRD